MFFQWILQTYYEFPLFIKVSIDLWHPYSARTSRWLEFEGKGSPQSQNPRLRPLQVANTQNTYHTFLSSKSCVKHDRFQSEGKEKIFFKAKKGEKIAYLLQLKEIRVRKIHCVLLSEYCLICITCSVHTRLLVATTLRPFSNTYWSESLGMGIN